MIREVARLPVWPHRRREDVESKCQPGPLRMIEQPLRDVLEDKVELDVEGID